MSVLPVPVACVANSLDNPYNGSDNGGRKMKRKVERKRRMQERNKIMKGNRKRSARLEENQNTVTCMNVSTEGVRIGNWIY
jgi:hypothetical protein